MRRAVHWLMLPLVALITPPSALAANIADFTDYSLQNSSGQILLPGRLFIPPEATSESASRRPLIVFLHGSGASGTNNVTQVEHTPDYLLDEAKSRGAFLYVPQTPNNWSSPTMIDSVMTMIDRAVADQNADADRLYVTGYSNGGGGTWNLLSRHSGRFAAALAVSSVMPASGFDAANLLDTAIFALHARDDATIPVDRSRTVINGILAAAGEPLPTYPAAGSNWHFMVSNPQFEFHRELADSAPPGLMINHLISRPDLDLIYFEQSNGGHTGLLGVYYWPPLYDWLFSHSRAVPEPSTLSFTACGLLMLAMGRRGRRGTTTRQLAAVA